MIWSKQFKNIIFVLIPFMAFPSEKQISEKFPRELRINACKDPPWLDPRRGSDMTASQFHIMLFEGLTRLNADLSISPAQAIDIQISPDCKRYTFTLGDNRWSDGTPVTAFDFEYSWKSILSPNFATNDAYLLYCVKGAADAKKGDIPLSDVGIRALNEKTLVVEMENPAPHFLEIAASSTLLPVNKKIDEQYPNWASDAGSKFVSNGPFAMKEWAHNLEMVVKKNPYFRKAKKIALDAIRISMIDDEVATLHMYASSLFDIIGGPLAPFPATAIGDLQKKGLLRIVPLAGTKTCLFNTKKFPFTNQNMRKAFSYAIDRQAIVAGVTRCNEEPATALLAPSLAKRAQKTLMPVYDLKLARQYFEKGLAELGVQKRELGDLTLTFYKIQLNQWVAQTIAKQWEEAFGIKVILEAIDVTTMHARMKKGDTAISFTGWIAEYNDPLNILERFKFATNPRNYSRWENGRYIEILDRASQTADSQKRSQLFDQAEEIIMEEMPYAPVYHGTLPI